MIDHAKLLVNRRGRGGSDLDSVSLIAGILLINEPFSHMRPPDMNLMQALIHTAPIVQLYALRIRGNAAYSIPQKSFSRPGAKEAGCTDLDCNKESVVL
jgi:hypothetical protein